MNLKLSHSFEWGIESSFKINEDDKNNCVKETQRRWS